MGRDLKDATPEGRRMLTYQRRSTLHLFAVVFALVVGLALTLGAMLSAAQAQESAPQYTFTKVADSAEDGFDPFSFECSAINNRGDIAFRTARPARGGGARHPGHLPCERKRKETDDHRRVWGT